MDDLFAVLPADRLEASDAAVEGLIELDFLFARTLHNVSQTSTYCLFFFVQRLTSV